MDLTTTQLWTAPRPETSVQARSSPWQWGQSTWGGKCSRSQARQRGSSSRPARAASQ